MELYRYDATDQVSPSHAASAIRLLAESGGR